MNFGFAIRCIGASHLLQPPLTFLLAKRLDLPRAFSVLPPLAAQIARNMAFASVFFPTAVGVLIALFSGDVVTGGSMRWLAWLLAAFWTWRMLRQVIVGPLMPMAWHCTLCGIFAVQGPLLAGVLAWLAPP